MPDAAPDTAPDTAQDNSLRNLVESAGDVIHSVTAEGRITYVNPSWLSTLGYVPGEALGQNIENFIHPDYRDTWKQRFQAALSGSATGRFETACIHKNGGILHLEGRCYRGGSTGQVFGIFQDITDRKRAEEVLARQADQLLRVSRNLDRRDQEIAEQLDQARRYREAQARAEELTRINEDLEAEIERRRQAEAKITASLREKEVLLKEIHHRVKNNLQIISSLLNLQVGEAADEPARALFNDSQTRIRSMALIHERLYQSDDLATVDFSEYVDSLGRFIFRSYAPANVSVHFETDIETTHLGLDEAIPCGLIVNELICNALKYGFVGRSEGRVWVRFRSQEDGSRHLVVGDDGIGVPETVTLNNPTTLGLRLVTTLVGQLGGHVDLDTSTGSVFQIRF